MSAAPQEACLPGGDGVSRVSRTTANLSVGKQTAPADAAPYRERVVNRMLRYARKMLYSRTRRMRRGG